MRLPSKWHLGTIDDVVASLDSGVSVNGEDRPIQSGETAVLKVGAVSYGRFDASAAKAVIPDELDRVKEPVANGRIIISRSNSPELVGSSVRVTDNYQNLYLSDKLWQIKVKANCHESWLFHVLQLPVIKMRMALLATGTSNSMKNISKESFLGIDIPIPPKEEQKKLADRLDKMARLCDAIVAIIDRAKRRRSALTQTVLSGKKRFPGFSRRWRKTTVADICVEESIRNDGRLGREAVRAVNKAEGMIPMKDHVISDNLTRYKIVKPGWYAYNPMRINIGSICQWHGKDDALVSPDYVVFRCLPDKVDQRFFNAFRRSFRWDAFMARAGSGGVRIRIYFDDLGMLGLPIPELDEQRRIGAVFETVDGEIGCLERLLVALQRQKHALMQQLLTGKRRVQAPTR